MDQNTAQAAEPPPSIEYELMVRDLLEATFRSQMDGLDLEVQHNVRVAGSSGHKHQIDILATFKLGGFKFIVPVECKKYSSKVPVKDLLTFAGRLSDIGAHKGIVVSTVGFDQGASRIAKKHNIALVIAVDASRLGILMESPMREGMLRVRFFRKLYRYLFDSSERNAGGRSGDVLVTDITPPSFDWLARSVDSSSDYVSGFPDSVRLLNQLNGAHSAVDWRSDILDQVYSESAEAGRFERVGPLGALTREYDVLVSRLSGQPAATKVVAGITNKPERRFLVLREDIVMDEIIVQNLEGSPLLILSAPALFAILAMELSLGAQAS